MTQIQPELWVDMPSRAITFYEAAFGATVLHRVGEGDEIVAQLAIGQAGFWVTQPSAELKRLSPLAIDGATSRTCSWSTIRIASTGKPLLPARQSSRR
jgi:predicted enzyme related to lactoylglutathione lyase